MRATLVKYALKRYCYCFADHSRSMCTIQKTDFDIEKYFTRSDVQHILRQITGFNVNKIFMESKISSVDPPKYKLLTSEQLDGYKKAAFEHGHDLLQMPPAKNPWHAVTRILCVDDIANFEKSSCRYVFTDITYGLPHRQRAVVVRESENGTLRLASREEQDRVLHVYYPRAGKMFAMPKMFMEENLEKVLAEHRYQYVLDRACVQFEPDDPNYIRVSQRTYEHIENEGRFDDLRSTRHFGPMAFYLSVQKRIDGLLIDMLQRSLLSDARDLIKLYHILHPQCKSAVEVRRQLSSVPPDPRQLIQLFIQLDAVNGGAIELALLSLNELQHASSAKQL